MFRNLITAQGYQSKNNCKSVHQEQVNQDLLFYRFP